MTELGNRKKKNLLMTELGNRKKKRNHR